MKLHSTKATNAWGRQCAFPSAGYTSEQMGIWHDVRVTRDSAPTVGDKAISKGKVADCRGNLIPRRDSATKRWMVAKVKVELMLDSLTPAERLQVSNTRKWQMVEQVAAQA